MYISGTMIPGYIVNVNVIYLLIRTLKILDTYIIHTGMALRVFFITSTDLENHYTLIIRMKCPYYKDFTVY